MACIERRLGRILTPDDFIDALVNEVIYLDTPRMASRKEGWANQYAENGDTVLKRDAARELPTSKGLTELGTMLSHRHSRPTLRQGRHIE